MTKLRAGQKPPANSIVTLYHGVLDSRRTLEWFATDDNPDWVCPRTGNGFWYGYETIWTKVDSDAPTEEPVTVSGWYRCTDGTYAYCRGAARPDLRPQHYNRRPTWEEEQFAAFDALRAAREAREAEEAAYEADKAARLSEPLE